MEASSISATGMERKPLIERYFTHDRMSPLDNTTWTERDVRLGDFKQDGVEAPEQWSDNAVGIVAKLYFATVNGVKERSVRTMIDRVARTITTWGLEEGYFGEAGERIANEELIWTPEAYFFYDELCYLLVNQMATFNTPVWLNLGVPGRKPTCSACYLLHVDDTMLGARFGGKGDHSIMDWVATESAVFKQGAGSGINLSKLRGSMEPLSTGGTASGPTSYMRVADANAGTLKSGGAHRRAAKLVVLNDDHPDVADFIDMKRREDRRMRILKDAGVEIDPFTRSGEKTIAEATSFQNENVSMGTHDAFMRLADQEGGACRDWDHTWRTTGQVERTVDARAQLEDVADAAWECGDPGLIFLDRCNEWHTTPMLRGEPSPITTANPCIETIQNDDTSCNLGSLNIMKFLVNGELQVEAWRRAVDVMILAMDITCSRSHSPTESIARNTRELRQLGLGYANLGAALMSKGLAYDSDAGRDWAASLTALLTGRAYRRSAELAATMGAYACFEENRAAHLAVVAKHGNSIAELASGEIWSAAYAEWMSAVSGGELYGFRNSQVTVLPPTGTTSLMMDCDSSGPEPCFALETTKGLAGGGTMKMAVSCVTPGLRALGYVETDIQADGLDAFLTWLSPEHRVVFNCANEISYEGHVRMVAALQPFVSGSISKTVNLAESATRRDIFDTYMLSWRLGCKAVSVFRSNSKVTSILSSASPKKEERLVDAPRGKAPTTDPSEERSLSAEGSIPARLRLRPTRKSLTHKIHVGDWEGYVTAGMYENGRLGEIFVEGFGKAGSFTANALSAWATDFSIALQYQVPFEVLCRKHRGVSDETGGMVVPNGEPLVIRSADSIIDYIARWLALEFGDRDLREEFGVLTPVEKMEGYGEGRRFDDVLVPVGSSENIGILPGGVFAKMLGHAREPDTRPCSSCGGTMRRTGTCYTCSCGNNTGCG